MRGDHTSVPLGLAITSIVYCASKGARQACPVVVRDEVPVSIKGSLRLLVNDTEDLVNCGEPCTELKVSYNYTKVKAHILHPSWMYPLLLRSKSRKA